MFNDIDIQSTVDVAVDSASVSSLGNRLRLSVGYENLGTTNTPGLAGQFLWSSDNILDSSDRVFRSSYIPPMVVGQEISQNFSLSERPRVSEKYLIIKADTSNRLSESDELNNVKVLALPGTTPDPVNRPDLSISNTSLNMSTITQGYGFVPRYTLNNTGNAIAPPSTTRYVVSADTILGNSDDVIPTFLSNGGVDAALNPGTSRLESNDYLAIYNNLSSGTYNLFVIADGTNMVSESNETNNVARISFNFEVPPKPDLVVEQLNLPDSANAGGYINLSYTIRNLDLGYVGYSNIAFYLSTDNTIDASDVNLGSHMATSSTPQGVPISRNYSLFLDPDRVSAGTYNLIARIDPNGSVTESNENNNTLVKTITINPLLRPNLSVANIPASNAGSERMTFSTGILSTIPYTIVNNGAAVSRSRTTFYLSTDATLSTSGDLLAGHHSIGEMGSFQERSEAVSLYLNPSAIEDGTNNYYLIAVADSLGEIAESSETNNITVIPVTVVDAGTTRFSIKNGYGLVNAEAAIARTLNLPSLPDVPNTQSWGADLIKAPEVWNAGYTGAGITVAVIDTGVDYNHPDLINNIWSNNNEIPNNGIDDDGNNFIDDVRGWDFVSNDNAPLDPNGHGTHVAGIIAASRNSFGVTGIAYDAKIMPLRVLGGGDQWGNVNNAIRYAVDNGARVINMSLAGNTTDQDGRLKEALQYASNRGVIVVMAAGNNSGMSPLMPASFASNWGIAVGAVNSNGAMANYSNRAGGQPNLAYVTAPSSANSTLPNNRYRVMNGTSMASPHVAGVVALMLSANPSLTDADIRAILSQG